MCLTCYAHNQEVQMAEQTNGRKPFVKFLAQERARMAELRAKMNELIDAQLRGIDEAETRYAKELETKDA